MKATNTFTDFDLFTVLGALSLPIRNKRKSFIRQQLIQTKLQYA